MCCLFGLIDVKKQLSSYEKRRILSILGKACEARGTDATGFAYNSMGKLIIKKKAVPAHKMNFDIPSDAHVIMGHTRMTTQGSASKYENNHPFRGNLPQTQFALAHNGVLHNDTSLRKTHQLPHTNIETDSYIAVQLLERKKALDFHSLKHMAELVKGTFNFTLLDKKNRLYIVKGNNPLCLYYFRQAGLYLYASTKTILDTALILMGYHHLPHEEILISDGEILRIDSHGNRSSEFFQEPVSYYRPYSYPLYDYWEDETESEYHQFLMDYAAVMGVPQKEMEYLHDAGLMEIELEECLYDKDYREICLYDTGYYDEMEDYHDYFKNTART